MKLPDIITEQENCCDYLAGQVEALIEKADKIQVKLEDRRTLKFIQEMYLGMCIFKQLSDNLSSIEFTNFDPVTIKVVGAVNIKTFEITIPFVEDMIYEDRYLCGKTWIFIELLETFHSRYINYPESISDDNISSGNDDINELWVAYRDYELKDGYSTGVVTSNPSDKQTEIATGSGEFALTGKYLVIDSNGAIINQFGIEEHIDNKDKLPQKEVAKVYLKGINLPYRVFVARDFQELV